MVENSKHFNQNMDSLEYYKFICSLSYRDHPICDESDDVRRAYASLLHDYTRKDGQYMKYYQPIVLLYEHRFRTTVEETLETHLKLQFTKQIRKTRWSFKKLRLRLYSYKYLFFANYLLFIYGRCSLDNASIQAVKQELKINDRDAQHIVYFTNALKDGNFEIAKSYVEHKKFRHLTFFYDMYKKQRDFLTTKEKRCLIVGTMSAGKSTFLNSLVGKDVFPAKNEACTAKKFFYTYRTDMEHFIVQHDKSECFEYVLHNIERKMKALNENKASEQVFIEGSMSQLLNIKNRVVLIDTPGPNNSMNRIHEKVTVEAIRNETYDTIFYIMNATQLGTDDDLRLLHHVKEYISNHPEKEVVFIVNKADKIDEEKDESLQQLLEIAKTYVEQNGFENPNIMLFSAYVSNLCQKVAHSKSLTEKEQLEFDFFYKRFSDEKKDLSKYSTVSYVFHPDISDMQQEIKTKEKTYDMKRVYVILRHSGIYQIKNFM
ncbi:dynamin family protein [Anoxybacillus ayderensis]|uniref:dynamin family protein n=1 Tax=Anoxybacillus ayderensis TaxID=265546 RepID=UPI002E1BFE16|nr:dynamin family protein [Anoxybacillus ayderensis]